MGSRGDQRQAGVGVRLGVGVGKGKNESVSDTIVRFCPQAGVGVKVVAGWAKA